MNNASKVVSKVNPFVSNEMAEYKYTIKQIMDFDLEEDIVAKVMEIF